MSALFTDHATHVAAAQMTDPACASVSFDTAAAAAAAAAAACHYGRESCESDQATASSACSTDHVHDTLAPAAMLRDAQASSAVCPSSPNSLAMSLHNTLPGSSTSQATLNESAITTFLEEDHSEYNVPVEVGIGVHIAPAASHPASPESTALQLGVNQSEPGEPTASSAAPSPLTRADLLPESSGLTTLPPADAQAAVESAGPSSQAHSLSNACSLEQHLAMDTDPNSSSAEAQELAAPGALISTTDPSASISSAASLPQLDAGKALCTAVGCQVTGSETSSDGLAGFSPAEPSSSPRASPAAAISSAGASPADQSNLTQTSPAGSCTADPSSIATTAPGATSISAGASPASCSSPAGTSRSVPASPNDTSSISEEAAADSGSSAGASPASSVSPSEASPAVAGTPAVSSLNASSQSATLNLQIAGCADAERVEVQNGGKSHSAVSAEALFEAMSHVSDGSTLALPVLNHSLATVRSYEHASQQNASSNLAQQKDNSSGDSITNRQLGAVHAEMLELMDACGVHESLKELIAADAQCFDYKADELLCSMCSNIRAVSCLSR